MRRYAYAPTLAYAAGAALILAGVAVVSLGDVLGTYPHSHPVLAPVIIAAGLLLIATGAVMAIKSLFRG